MERWANINKRAMKFREKEQRDDLRKTMSDVREILRNILLLLLFMVALFFGLVIRIFFVLR